MERCNEEGNGAAARKCAFAICATGRRYLSYRDNLVRGLREHVPGVDVVDIDPGEARGTGIFEGLPESQTSLFARLAIPLMPTFRAYDRVVWLDADIDIVSDSFRDIFSVKAGPDGVACAEDMMWLSHIRALKLAYPRWSGRKYFNGGVMMLDIANIDEARWRDGVSAGIQEHLRVGLPYKDQDIVNLYFRVCEMDAEYNWLCVREVNENARAIHYVGPMGHRMLEDVIVGRGCDTRTPGRYVAASLRHRFVKSWLRSYFLSGNLDSLILAEDPLGDWTEGDWNMCRSAAELTGGKLVKCPGGSMADMARIVAADSAVGSWAWIDGRSEITSSLFECFEAAEEAPGFVFAQFRYPRGHIPETIDPRHLDVPPGRSVPDEICLTSMVFFHGEANKRIVEDGDALGKDDRGIFGNLYRSNPAWHDGFCDFSIRKWQEECAKPGSEPRPWFGKVLFHCGAGSEAEWSRRGDSLPAAPFEPPGDAVDLSKCNGPVDAVFVIGTGSENGNEELRYALRNLEANCGFIRDVYICGHCPAWVDRSAARVLSWPDRFDHAKDANIIDKLRHACEHPGISDRILFCSDDQFVTRKCTWADFEPRYLRAYSPKDDWFIRRRRPWHFRLRATLDRERDRRLYSGLDPNKVYYYQPHMWMQIDRDSFLSYARWCGYESRDDTIIASGYFNYISAPAKFDFDHAFLCGAEKVLPDAVHIGYCDSSFNLAMGYLRKVFPNKSRFEL